MMSMKNFIELTGNAAETLGVLLILGGFVVAAARFVPLRARSDTSAYLRLRHDLGRAILLGLEVLVAADIIRTVAFTPDLNGAPMTLSADWLQFDRLDDRDSVRVSPGFRWALPATLAKEGPRLCDSR